jgi:hypothetical protein
MEARVAMRRAIEKAEQIVKTSAGLYREMALSALRLLPRRR